MILNFIFQHLHTVLLAIFLKYWNLIFLIIWIAFLIIVAIRFFKPVLVRNISYSRLVFVAFFLNIFYGIFMTLGQYYVWATSDDFKINYFLNLPLSKNTPIFEWLRPLFENNLGYFLYYVWGRFWLYIILLLVLSIVFYFLIKLWKSWRGGFSDEGPKLILILMLISGWPGIILFIPLGFICSMFYSVFANIKGGNKVVLIEPVFIFTCLIALIFGKVLITFL